MVFNLTDSVPAAPDRMTPQAAQRFVRRFSRERMPADRVELEIIDVGTEPPYVSVSNNGGGQA